MVELQESVVALSSALAVPKEEILGRFWLEVALRPLVGVVRYTSPLAVVRQVLVVHLN
jgi:hypothetical protein